MSETDSSASANDRKRSRKLWPWVITSIVALLTALFLTVWIPQKHDTELLERIDAAGAFYFIDTTGRPETRLIPDDLEYVGLFDRLEQMRLPRTDPELFRDAVTTFPSVEYLKFDLANSTDFDRDAASRMTQLVSLRVDAYEEPTTTDYEFLAGCQSVKYLFLDGIFHNGGFWQYLPEMKSLTHLEGTVRLPVHGAEVPDLSKSKLVSLSVGWSSEGGELHNWTSLLAAPRLKRLTLGGRLADIQPVTLSGSPALEELALGSEDLTDDVLPILAQCKSLRNLRLYTNQLTGESLDLIAALPLETIILSGNPLTEEACRDLAQFTTLEKLDLWSCELQTDWLAHWADSPLSASVRSLSLHGNEIGDAAIDVLLTFSNLQQLNLCNTDISEEALLKLNEHPTLESVAGRRGPYPLPLTPETARIILAPE